MWATIVFTLAVITDACDGYLARRYGMISPLGSFLDPLADKLLTSAVFVSFYIKGLVAWWFLLIIFSRDLAITLLRSVLLRHGYTMQTSWLAKYKTSLQFAMIYALFAALFVVCLPNVPTQVHTSVLGIKQFLLWLTITTTIWSGLDYLYKNWHIIKKIIKKKHS